MKPRARWALCTWLGVFACSSDVKPLTQIVVVVDSDLDVPSELNGLSLEVSHTVESEAATAQLAKPEDLPRSLGIVWSGGPFEPVRVTVQGLLDGTPVVTRSAEVSFQKNKSLRLSLLLARACRDLHSPCDDGESCDAGGCVDETIASLPPWSGELPPHSNVTMPGADAGTRPAADGGGTGARAGRDAAGAGGAGGNGGTSGSAADNQPPQCQIDEPSPDASFFEGDSVALSGSCSDPDGAAPELVTWRSSIDEAIGSSYTTHFTPSVGRHTITFCGADRRDSTLPGCSSVTITVEPLPDITAMISSIKQGSSTAPPFSTDSNVTALGSGSGIDPIKLRWTDSLLGELGSAAMQALASPVTAGKHALALTVTDARSRSATATSSNFNVLASGQSSLFESYAQINNAFKSAGPVVALDADVNSIYAGWQSQNALYRIDRSKATATVSAELVTLFDVSQQLRDIYLHGSSGTAYLALSSGYEACTNINDSVSCTTSKSQSNKPCATGDTTRIVRVTSIGSGSSQDFVLLGTPVGLCVCDAANVGSCDLSSKLSSVAVTSFTVSSGMVWIGTSAGLYKIDLTANDGVTNPTKEGAVPGSLTALALGDTALWVGSVTGVTRMDPSNGSTSTWATSTSAGAFQRLISSDIRAVAVSRPVLGSSGQREVAWIATSAGVSRFDASIPSFTSFTSGDALPSNSVRAVLVLSSGEKVFGTDSGLALYRGP